MSTICLHYFTVTDNIVSSMFISYTQVNISVVWCLGMDLLGWRGCTYKLCHNLKVNFFKILNNFNHKHLTFWFGNKPCLEERWIPFLKAQWDRTFQGGLFFLSRFNLNFLWYVELLRESIPGSSCCLKKEICVLIGDISLIMLLFHYLLVFLMMNYNVF